MFFVIAVFITCGLVFSNTADIPQYCNTHKCCDNKCPCVKKCLCDCYCKRKKK